MKRRRPPEHLAALQVQGEDIPQVVGEERRAVDRRGRDGGAQRVGFPLSQFGGRHAGFDRVRRTATARPGRPSPRDAGPAPTAGRRRRRLLRVDARFSSLDEASQELARRGRLAPEGDLLVVVAIRQLGADLLEFGSPARAEQCQSGLHREQARAKGRCRGVRAGRPASSRPRDRTAPARNKGRPADRPRCRRRTW